MSGADNIMEEAPDSNRDDDQQAVKQLRFNLKTGVRVHLHALGSRSS